MGKYISDEIKKRIKEQIQKAEAKSSAEIAVVVSDSCDSYRYSITLFSLLFALVLPFLAKIFIQDIDELKSFEIAIVGFMFASFVLQYSQLKYKIVPKKVKNDRCKKRALSEFYRLGIDKTSNHKAILIFVSIKERYIEIVCDREIDKVVDKSIWIKLVDGFITFAKNGEIGLGVENIVKECSKIVTKNFPRDDSAKDELSNEVIEI